MWSDLCSDMIMKNYSVHWVQCLVWLILGSTEGGWYDMSRQSSESGCDSMVLLTTHERDEEQLQDRWSPSTTSPGLLLMHAHTHTHSEAEQSPSCASKSPDGPSALPPCPAWCQASSAHWSPAQFSTHFLAGGKCDSPACWRSNANRYSLLLLCCHMSSKKKKKKLSVWLSTRSFVTKIIRQTHYNAAHIQKCF